MSKEGLYSILVELPKKENEYLSGLTRFVGKGMNLNYQEDNFFHLTLKKTSYCDNRNARVDLRNWIEMQEPFELTLDTIGKFNHRNGTILYLTTSDLEKRNKIIDLHDGIEKFTKSEVFGQQNNSKFVPHVTLFHEIPKEKSGEVKEKIIQNIEPISLTISSVLVRKKVDDYNWKNFGRFNLGTDYWTIENFYKPQMVGVRQLT